MYIEVQRLARSLSFDNSHSCSAELHSVTSAYHMVCCVHKRNTQHTEFIGHNCCKMLMTVLVADSGYIVCFRFYFRHTL